MVGIVNVDTTYAASKKKIHIMTKTVNLVIGNNVTVGTTFQQSLLNKKGKIIKKKVKWKSKNPAVATINKKGMISAVNIGTTQMTAKYKGKTYKFSVIVKQWTLANGYTPEELYTLRETVRNAGLCAYEMTYALADWYYEEMYYGHSASQPYYDKYKENINLAIFYLKQAQAITASKPTVNCRSSEALGAGFSTWDSMLRTLINEFTTLSIQSHYGYTSESYKAYNNARAAARDRLVIAFNEINTNWY